MTIQPNPTESPHAGDGPLLHNPVLIRSRDIAESRRGWIAPTLAGLAVAIGAAVVLYVETHPAKPLINHAVATAPMSPGQSTAS